MRQPDYKRWKLDESTPGVGRLHCVGAWACNKLDESRGVRQPASCCRLLALFGWRETGDHPGGRLLDPVEGLGERILVAIVELDVIGAAG